MFDDFFSLLPSYVISLPVVLLALSFHEMSHGYAALKLGDPTARNLGRLTLNPLKHLHPIGFLMMIFFHVGFANPVPINARNFKNPRRDMAISALAGPLSNILLAIASTIVLRLLLLLCGNIMADDFSMIYVGQSLGTSYAISALGTVLCIFVYMAYLSVIVNLGLAIFNLIPIPPLDGSRIFYIILPPKWYFAVMKYERIIMVVMIVLLFFGILDWPLTLAREGLASFLFRVTGMGMDSEAGFQLTLIRLHINSLL